MRVILIILASITFFSLEAQVHSSVNNMNYAPWSSYHGYHSFNDSSHLGQKWFFSKYAGISAGFGLFNGGRATVFSAPVGLQLNRPLNANLIAFAGISAAPAFFNFTQSFTNPVINKSYPGGSLTNAYGFGMSSRIEMGLMYINDAKTFSVSGSIGVEKSSFPSNPLEHSNTLRK